jgi:hypothetical protein
MTIPLDPDKELLTVEEAASYFGSETEYNSFLGFAIKDF